MIDREKLKRIVREVANSEYALTCFSPLDMNEEDHERLIEEVIDDIVTPILEGKR